MLNSKVILVIEDSRVCMALIKAFFRNTGVRLLEAESMAQSLLLLEKHKPDLIISDLRLPDVEGTGIINEIKRAAPDIPLMIQTGSFMDLQADECLDAGCSALITKPYTREMFLGKVRELIDCRCHRFNGNSMVQV